MNLTQKQLDALYELYQQWQKTTSHAIMPIDYTLVPVDAAGGYVGVWVGPEHKNGDPGRMYLGIEPDGHVHS